MASKSRSFKDTDIPCMKRFRVVVAMKPLVFHDLFPRKPDKAVILEILIDKLKDGELDDNFIVIVEG